MRDASGSFVPTRRRSNKRRDLSLADSPFSARDQAHPERPKPPRKLDPPYQQRETCAPSRLDPQRFGWEGETVGGAQMSGVKLTSGDKVDVELGSGNESLFAHLRNL